MEDPHLVHLAASEDAGDVLRPAAEQGDVGQSQLGDAPGALINGLGLPIQSHEAQVRVFCGNPSDKRGIGAADLEDNLSGKTAADALGEEVVPPPAALERLFVPKR